jgi:hypothetical protein
VLVRYRITARRLGRRQRRSRRDLEFELARCDLDHDGVAVAKHRPIAVDLDAQRAVERRQRSQVRLHRPFDSARRRPRIHRARRP